MVVPVFAPDVIGYLVLGHVIDDTLAERLKADTGTEISFLTAERVFASSWPADTRERFVPSGEFRATLLERGSCGSAQAADDWRLAVPLAGGADRRAHAEAAVRSGGRLL